VGALHSPKPRHGKRKASELLLTFENKGSQVNRNGNLNKEVISRGYKPDVIEGPSTTVHLM